MHIERNAKQRDFPLQEPHEHAGFISPNQVTNAYAWSEKIEIVFTVDGLQFFYFRLNPVFTIRRTRLNGLVVILIANSQRVITSGMREWLIGWRVGLITGDHQAAGQEEQNTPADTHN
jgi:hypothetical protein